MTSMRKITELELDNKTVIVRIDLNVTIVHNKVIDYTRINRIKPTIDYLLSKGTKIVLLSHFGRPKGQFVRSMSLAPLVDELSNLLGQQVKFAVDCVGNAASEAIATLEPGDVILMENLRFHPGEEKGDLDFAKQLASLGDIYINDTFSCSHRAHASITALAQLLPSAAGFLLEEELYNLDKILNTPERPISAIVGGGKVSSKLGLLHSLVQKVDMLAIGGAMANTFLAAQGINIGTSICEQNLFDSSLRIIELAKEHGCDVVLPVDVITARNLTSSEECKVVQATQVDDQDMMLDIGPKTIAIIAQKLETAKTIVWNGPMGAFEYRPFDIGTISLARYVAGLTNSGQITSVVGGGDIVSALTMGGLAKNFSYISTGGGAFLEWLEGKQLPGINALLSS